MQSLSALKTKYDIISYITEFFLLGRAISDYHQFLVFGIITLKKCFISLVQAV